MIVMVRARLTPVLKSGSSALAGMFSATRPAVQSAGSPAEQPRVCYSVWCALPETLGTVNHAGSVCQTSPR